MVAADLGLRTEALPLLTLLDELFQREVRCLFLEDNQSTLTNIRTGKHQALRHANRAHRVNCHWISETCRSQPIDLGARESHLMAADIFTNVFDQLAKWREVKSLIAHCHWRISCCCLTWARDRAQQRRKRLRLRRSNCMKIVIQRLVHRYPLFWSQIPQKMTGTFWSGVAD